MRIALVAAAALAFGAPALAQSPPGYAVRNGAAQDPATDVHIAGASVPEVPFAEWEVINKGDQTVQIALGKEAVAKAPANAVRYTQKNFVFPTGSIRVLTFKKAQGGVLHAITRENALFVLNGAVTVDVAGKNVALKTGDAAYYPSGILRGTGDATVIVWMVTGTVGSDAAKAQVVRAKDAPTQKSAEWDANGKRVRVNTPADLAKAPKNAIRLAVTRYQFDGNSIRVAHNYKGGPTSPSIGGIDALIYVVSGKLKFYHDDHEVDAVPGDALREAAGAKHYWYRVEDSSFIAISSIPIAGVKAGPTTER